MTTLTPNDWRALQALLPPGGLVTDPVELITYEIDAGPDRGSPQAVAFPRGVEDVVAVVRWAADLHVPLVARGAGTGLSGGAVASQGGLILSFSRMDRVLEFDKVGRSVVVQPGVVNLALDELVRSRGLYYPPDPASGRSATIGGNIAENAGGPHCFKYGVTTNYVAGLQAVLADGQVVRTGGLATDYPEYDFTGLLTGSEGTLAIITRASLRLIRNPQSVKTMMVSFDSLEAASEAVSTIIARQLVPATMEMMDRNIIGIAEAYIHADLPTDAAAMLIIEADGYQESLDPQIEEIAAILHERHGRDLRVAHTEAEREQIWYGRKSAGGAMARISPSRYGMDSTVPRSKLAKTITGINQICARHNLRVGYIFHAGDGNLHPSIFFDPDDADMVKRMVEAVREVMELCVQQGGSITGEHGVGLEKREFMPLMYSPDELAVMREVKEVFDRHDLLNPGKIFPEARHRDAAPTGLEDIPPTGSGDATPASIGDATLRQGDAAPTSGGTTGSGGIPMPPHIPMPLRFVPENDEEAADWLRAAQAAGQPVIVQGGGSQMRYLPESWELSGRFPTLLSTEKLQGVVAYASEDLYVTVRASTPLADLQAMLAADGLWAPLVSPWAESTIGGLVSTNLNGPQRMRYGAVRDLVLGMRVVLPDGRYLRLGRPLVKNVAGYDMVKLFVGAYGTLGLITEVTLRLSPLPRARRSLLAAVDDLDLGLALGRSLLNLSYVASSVLLCRGCLQSPGVPPGRYLLVFSAEGHPQDVTAELRMAQAAMGTTGAVTETDSLVGADLWAGLLRNRNLPESRSFAALTTRLSGRWSPMVRIGVPPKDLPAYLEVNGATLETMSYVADFASGLIHVCPATTAQLPALRQAALALGGYAVVTQGADDLDPWGYAPETLPLMRRLKACWDPAGCLNPGVFLV